MEKMTARFCGAGKYCNVSVQAMKLPTILPLQSLEYQIYLILDAG
jgi:hypothetical protein